MQTEEEKEPWRYGMYEMITCFHPNPEKEIQSFGVPIDVFGFLCLSIGEATSIKFRDPKAYEDHKKEWEIETKPIENLEAYLLRNNLLMGTDFII